MTTWSGLDEATKGRCVLWNHSFSELIEIVALLELNNANASNADIARADRDTVGNEPSWALAMGHLRQHLTTKVSSIYASGDPANSPAPVPVAVNKIIERWRGPMKEHAKARGVNVAEASRLIKQLKLERHNLVAHKSGRFAEVSRDADGNIMFRGWLPPLSSAELAVLKQHFRACRDFVSWALLRQGVPAYPYELSASVYHPDTGRWDAATRDITIVSIASDWQRTRTT